MLRILLSYALFLNIFSFEKDNTNNESSDWHQKSTQSDTFFDGLNKNEDTFAKLNKELEEKNKEIEKLQKYIQEIKSDPSLEKYDPFYLSNGFRLNNPTDPNNVENKKRTAKKALKDKGYISHAKKHLLLFCSSLKEENGSKFLVEVAQLWESLKGQVVYMVGDVDNKGIDNETKNNLIDAINNGVLKNTFLFYSENKTQISVGGTCYADASDFNKILTRFASNFTLFPCKIDPCRTEVIISLISGSLPITSWVGEKNLVKPLGQKGENINFNGMEIKKDSFNGYSFLYDHNEVFYNKYEPENRKRLQEVLKTAMNTITNQSFVYYNAATRAIKQIHNGDYYLGYLG